MYIMIRLLLLILIGYAIVWILTQTHFWLVSFWLILLSVVLFIELLHYIEKSHKEMRNLVIAIREGDFSNTYRQVSYRSGNMLGETFEALLTMYQRLRQEKESHHLYLQNMVEHVNIALLCFDQQGKMQMANKAAHQLFAKPYLKHLDDIKEVDAELHQTLQKVAAGEKLLIKILLHQQLMHLSLQATEFKMLGEYYKLVSLQDFKNELEEQEIDSWQKLIRVLSHEIMNSVIPISNLSAMVKQTLFSQEEGSLSFHDISAEDRVDLQESLQTIEERCNGLVSFVKAYRSLTQIAIPHFRSVSIHQLLERVYTLFRPDLLRQRIQCSIQVTPDHLSIKADFELIEQVLINLISNAIDALADCPQPEITLKAIKNAQNQTLIQVIDNGPGIEDEWGEQIFIPFFTTKKNGSGIGLSLSRQIMRLHKGTITMHTQAGRETIFSLIF